MLRKVNASPSRQLPETPHIVANRSQSQEVNYLSRVTGPKYRTFVGIGMGREWVADCNNPDGWASLGNSVSIWEKANSPGKMTKP